MEQRKTAFNISFALGEEERSRAVAYIEAQMREHFACEPPATTGLVCVVSVEEGIAATLVMEGCADDAPFPIEGHYAHDDYPFPCARAFIVQGTRWIASAPGASLIVLRATMGLAYTLGKRYMLIEAKPYSVKRLVELGIVVTHVEGVRLLHERVREEVGDAGMKYFVEPPYPTLYLMDLAPRVSK